MELWGKIAKILILFSLLVAGEPGALAGPNASIKINGSGSSTTVKVGEPITVTWSSSGGSSASSYYVTDVEACNSDGGSKVSKGPHSYIANTLSGSHTVNAWPCLAGVTITLTYVVRNSAGDRNSSRASVTIQANGTSTGTSTSTSTGTQTGTGTYTSTGTSTSTVTHAVRHIEGIALDSSGNQQGALFEISRVNDSAADVMATEAALDCMSGANSAKEGADAAADLNSCKKRFEAANDLKDNSQLALNNTAEDATAKSLSAHEEVLGSDRAQHVIATFEKNFKQDGREFLEKLIDSKGDRQVMAELEGKGLTDEQISQAMAAADALTVNPDTLLNSSMAKKNIPAPILRDSLKKKLQEQVSRAPASAEIRRKEPARGRTESKLNNMEKLDPAQVFGLSETSDSELNLFEIIHLRMRELTVRHKL